MRSARRGQLRNCSIVVVKLDRLSEACFHQLTDEKVRFFVAELRPDVDPFAMHIYAALAEKERRNIPIRIQQDSRPLRWAASMQMPLGEGKQAQNRSIRVDAAAHPDRAAPPAC